VHSAIGDVKAESALLWNDNTSFQSLESEIGNLEVFLNDTRAVNSGEPLNKKEE
jgi:hypothetical protein